MDFHGLPWTLMDTKLPMGMEFHGHPWTSVNFHRHPWASRDIGGYKAAHGQAIPWTPMDTHGHPRTSIKWLPPWTLISLSRGRRRSTAFHENRWNLMEPH